ncbi:hypothetical protein C1645_767165 [Glomus cerebriforme]|uniref:RING-type E3 ubiquitin transferase n=1 Tax=Glomus cerebriforme TaxID=658196 RepID=A0A397T5W6_9GLOM|nr:hypothetical protein C1645_767165 [Glomus cerebriforme]
MSSYRVNASSSRPICKYFANGRCNYGANCKYLHTREGNSSHSRNSDDEQTNHNNMGGSSSSMLHKHDSNSNYHRSNSSNNGTTDRVPPENLTVCKYFLEDRCMFGDSCWYKHEKPNEINEINTADSQKNDLKNQKDKQKAKEVEEEYTCAICYDTPKVFGLLVHCDHIFCRDCIQVWRKTSNVSSPFQDVDTTKTCPVCRKNSPYFVPSSRFAKSGPQKEQIISTYKEKISQIPCKYFEKSRKCPFADACFYQHANPDGSRCILGPPRKKKTRSYIRYFSADGDLDLSTISEIIDGFHFNITDWDDGEDGWDDDDDDEEIAYITDHFNRMEVVANEDDDDNVPRWATDWPNPQGWADGWEEFETNNGFSVLDHDEDCAMDLRNIY